MHPCHPPATDASLLEQLCLACGICCNGVLFRDVELQPGEDAARLRSLGLPVRTHGGQPRFNQPCAALQGCHCRIYAERPSHCRKFVCLLFQSVRAGKTEFPAALRVIRTALQRADRVRRLLRQLGDPDETLPLSRRFRQTARRLERATLDEESAECFGELTLAVHDLNCLLSEAFYSDVSAPQH